LEDFVDSPQLDSRRSKTVVDDAGSLMTIRDFWIRKKEEEDKMAEQTDTRDILVRAGKERVTNISTFTYTQSRQE
jgi:hypothetical protein